MSSYYIYHPEIAFPGESPALDAPSRAKARHGLAFDPFQYEARSKNRGLHSWDILLRNSTEPETRCLFIEDTFNDLQDAVSEIRAETL